MTSRYRLTYGDENGEMAVFDSLSPKDDKRIYFGSFTACYHYLENLVQDELAESHRKKEMRL